MTRKTLLGVSPHVLELKAGVASEALDVIAREFV
jgi:hypothetical protein